jgi:tetratricopeptide (TPR) repeat protein
MNTTGELLPFGFQGPVRSWSSFVATEGRRLCLPHDRAVWLADAAAVEPFDTIEVQAFTESLGRCEDALPRLARALADGGSLWLEIESVQSLRMLRLVLEGRPGSFDVVGSSDDPTLPLPLRRVLQATSAAGLFVHDVVRVRTAAPEFDGAMARDLFARGLVPFDWLEGQPADRFWLQCSRVVPLAGSVLIAGHDAAAREATRAHVAAWLPGDWEIVVAEAPRECAQWNRAVASSRGELVWLLRGGCLPSAELFRDLSVQAGVGPAAPGRDELRACPGDVVGLMLARNDVLLTGPLSEALCNTQIAVEEYSMRLDTRLPSARIVDGDFVAPAPAPEAPGVFAAETAALMQRWSPLVDSPTPAPAATSPAAPPPATPWAGRAPRISLCMIARDEERFLPGCLERARAAVDEIIVVDTGSKDRTVEIAESFGARVLHEPWQDDFSAPRNTALRAATGDWILVLDADEFLADDGPQRIRDLVQNPGISGYHLHFVNVYGRGRTLGVMMVRLFRNLPGVAYQNVIHEQVTPSLQRLGAERGLILSSAEVEVEHFGYSDEVMDRRGKNERNERLFVKQLAGDPDDIYSLYKYGDFLRRVPGRGADARRLLERCLEVILAGPPSLPRELPYAGEVAALCALEAARAGDHARARHVLDVALRRFLPTPNLHYLSASLALSEGRSHDAIQHYRRCLGYRGQVLVVPIQEGITSYVSLAGIAQAWMQQGDLDRARRLLAQAIAIEPSYEVAHLALSRLWLQRGDHQRALQTLTTFLLAHPDSPGACQQTTLILQRLGLSAQARRMGTRAVTLLRERSLDHEAAAMDRILATI